MPEPTNPNVEYLGDGLYADFDGYQIWLHANHYPSPDAVAIEPAVWLALVAYKEKMMP